VWSDVNRMKSDGILHMLFQTCFKCNVIEHYITTVKEIWFQRSRNSINNFIHYVLLKTQSRIVFITFFLKLNQEFYSLRSS
jgi:hypothetical protein